MSRPTNLTRDGIQLMINESIKAYEEEVGSKRHRENSGRLRRIENLIYIGYGVMATVGFIFKFFWSK